MEWSFEQALNLKFSKIYCELLHLVRVVKIDVMYPVCIGCHVDIHPNVFITFVRMDVGKYWVILRSPLLQLVTKKEFWLPIL
jgi:hypothetical protein